MSAVGPMCTKPYGGAPNYVNVLNATSPAKSGRRGGMPIIINKPVCPRCGCRDMRREIYGYRCFKCGHSEPSKVDPIKGWELWEKGATDE